MFRMAQQVMQTPVIQWVEPLAPLPDSDCPPGLEYLLLTDRLFIKQQIELLEAFTGFETANSYAVRDLAESKRELFVPDFISSQSN